MTCCLLGEARTKNRSPLLKICTTSKVLVYGPQLKTICPSLRFAADISYLHTITVRPAGPICEVLECSMPALSIRESMCHAASEMWRSAGTAVRWLVSRIMVDVHTWVQLGLWGKFSKGMAITQKMLQKALSTVIPMVRICMGRYCLKIRTLPTI